VQPVPQRKARLVESGELTNRSRQDYKAGCDLIVSAFSGEWRNLR